MIRVLLVDDQSIVREGLASLLPTQPDIEIVGEAENGKIAVERSLALSQILPIIICLNKATRARFTKILADH